MNDLCFASVVTADYFRCARVMLYSLIANGKITNGSIPFYIFHDADFDADMKKELRNIYPGTEFRLVDVERMGQYKKVNPKYWSIEAFRMYNFKKTIFLDADLLIVGDISGLAKTGNDISMVHEIRRDCFNAGVIVIDRDGISEFIYDALMKTHKKQNEFGHDQWIYNQAFKGCINGLDQKYNTLLSELPDDVSDVRIFHYIYKPDRESGKEQMPEDYGILWAQYEMMMNEGARA